jgi:hypothetical protein
VDFLQNKEALLRRLINMPSWFLIISAEQKEIGHVTRYDLWLWCVFFHLNRNRAGARFSSYKVSTSTFSKKDRYAQFTYPVIVPFKKVPCEKVPSKEFPRKSVLERVPRKEFPIQLLILMCFDSFFRCSGIFCLSFRNLSVRAARFRLNSRFSMHLIELYLLDFRNYELWTLNCFMKTNELNVLILICIRDISSHPLHNILKLKNSTPTKSWKHSNYNVAQLVCTTSSMLVRKR